jgi:ABC-type polysaccharide/polyol phosphate export permease
MRSPIIGELSPTAERRFIAHLPGAMFLRTFATRRSLIREMVRRDFTQRFVGSTGGWLWTLIHPLVLLACWVFVFQKCLRIPPPEGAGNNSTLYLFCGYLPWLLFSETVQRSASSLLDQANLITKTVFPSEIIPLTLFLSSLTSHLVAVAVAVIMIWFVAGHLSLLVFLLPLYLFLLGLFSVGVGWIAASLQVYLRDTAQLIIVLLTGWFWITPIFVDETHFPHWARFLLRWNPLSYVVKAYRRSLLSFELPDWGEVGLLALISTVAFVLGGIIFRHLKRGFADVL